MRTFVLVLCIMLYSVLDPVRATADVTENSHAGSDRSEPDAQAKEVEARRLIESFGAASVSLTEAMSAAERLHDGSRTVQISFDNSSVRGYRVRTLKDDRLWENIIDASTGKRAGDEKSVPLDQLSDEDRENIAALKFVRLQLADAIAVAEKATSGKALGGGLMKDGGKLNFIVIVASENRLKQVMLEPPSIARSGKESRRSP